VKQANKLKLFIPIACVTFVLLFACENPWMAAVLQEKIIYFDSNGGSPVASQKLLQGERVKRPIDPFWDGWVFEGWYEDNWSFDKPYDFNFIPTNPMILYAKWRAATPEDQYITSVAIFVESPITGAVPNTNASVATVGSVGYTCGTVTWTPSDNPFNGETQYTATVKLTANHPYTFEGLTAATINGFQNTNFSDNTGSTVTLSYQFSKTTEKAITGISVKTDQNKKNYIHGNTLELSGLVVTLTFGNNVNDTLDVEYGGFKTYGISAKSKGGGTTLSHTDDNGYPVTVYVGGLYANTNSTLTVEMATPETNDFDYSGNNWSQTIGNITPIKIKHKTGKTTGAITVQYTTSSSTSSLLITNDDIKKAPAGSYTITFDVAADLNWKAVNNLPTGHTLEIISVFTSGAALGNYLSNLSASTYTSSNPLLVDMKISNADDLMGIADVLKNTGIYVNLDLSGSTITEIPNFIFHINDGDDKLVGITLPTSIKKIDNNAFRACKGLTSIIIPDSVEVIGEYAFSGCEKLTSIIIPDSVKEIGGYAFYSCSSLKSVNIPANVDSIRDSIFSNCIELESIIIPDNIKSIGKNAFWECRKLIKVEFKGKIEQSLFDSNAFPIGNLRAKYIDAGGGIGTYTRASDGNTWTKTPTFFSIEDFNNYLMGQTENTATNPCYVKLNVDNLGGRSDLNGSLGKVLKDYPEKYVKLDLSGSTFATIEDEVFSGCLNLTSVIIPDNVTKIGTNTFLKCSALTSITIPNKVTSIGQTVFSDCTSLTSVTIGSDLTSFGPGAFSRCTSLTSIKFESANINLAQQTDWFIDAANTTSLKTAYAAGGIGTYTRPDTSSTVWIRQQP